MKDWLSFSKKQNLTGNQKKIKNYRLKEKQTLLNQIDFLKDRTNHQGSQKSLIHSRIKNQGYNSVRPERDDTGARFLSTYASTTSKISKGPKLLDSTASKSRLH